MIEKETTIIELQRCSKCGKLFSRLFKIGIFLHCYECAKEQGYD